VAHQGFAGAQDGDGTAGAGVGARENLQGAVETGGEGRGHGRTVARLIVGRKDGV